MKFGGILFDKDGTLFDYFTVWGPVISEYTQTILEDLQRSDSTDLRRRFLRLIGVGEDKMHAEGLVFKTNKLVMLFRLFVFCKMHHLPFRKMVRHIKTGFTDAHQYMEKSLLDNAPSDLVEKLFIRLSEAGYRIGIVTNDTALSTKVCIDHLRIQKYIDFTSTHDDHLPKKPNPEALKQFCSQFSLLPEQVVVIGDSPADMKFARNGGAGYAVAVLTGSNDIKRLKKYADTIYTDLQEIFNDTKIFPGGI